MYFNHLCHNRLFSGGLIFQLHIFNIGTSTFNVILYCNLLKSNTLIKSIIARKLNYIKMLNYKSNNLNKNVQISNKSLYKKIIEID